MWEFLTSLGEFFSRDPLGIVLDLADIGIDALLERQTELLQDKLSGLLP